MLGYLIAHSALKNKADINLCTLSALRSKIYSLPSLQGGLDPSKKSGVGVDFELLVRSLHVRNKRALRKPSIIFR